MEENVDVKALRARFTSPAPSSSRDSESPKSPRPAPQVKPFNPAPQVKPFSPGPQTKPFSPGPQSKPFSPGPDSPAPSPHRLSPSLPSPARAPPLSPGLKPPVDSNRVKQTGELLQNMMLRHQRPEGPRLSLVPPPSAAGAPVRQQNGPRMDTPLRAQSKQRSDDEVAPLRRPLPPLASMPLKPKRPAHVNLEPYKKFTRGAPPRGAHTPAGPRRASVSPLPASRLSTAPSPAAAPRLPLRDIKPGRLPRQTTTVDMDDQETYDDIGSLEKNDSWSDSGSLTKEEDPDELYEYIDEGQVEQIRAVAEKQKELLQKEVGFTSGPPPGPEVKPSKKELKRQQELERREAQERHKKEEQLRKNFQLQGEVEVLHTASVRHDWSGGTKLDLSVRQGERVDIIRVKNNPGGKWLARSTTGTYGYISNTCVDIDYDAIKRKATMIKRMERFDVTDLPPPPPDPPGYNQRPSDPPLPNPPGYNQRPSDPPLPNPPGYNQRSDGQDSDIQEEDEYDDVDPTAGSGWSSLDFPPPPIELNLDPKIEKELRKKFKFEGPLKVLHTMMVDPNAVIKKPGAKDLSVTPGDVLDVIELHSRKALCRNKFGKFGFVSRSLLLAMEGEIYDDVEYPNDVYDNDNVDF